MFRGYPPNSNASRGRQILGGKCSCPGGIDFPGVARCASRSTEGLMSKGHNLYLINNIEKLCNEIPVVETAIARLRRDINGP